MKKITCLSAIACIALTSCREEPADSGNQTIGVIPGGNTVVESRGITLMENFSPGIHYENSDPKTSTNKAKELRNKIKKFKHVDNNNLVEFMQTIKDFEQIRGTKVSVIGATIKDDKLTFEILGVQGTIDLRLNENFSQQEQFKANIDAIQWLNDRGEKLEFPLNINTFPSKLEVFSNSFGSNLDEIKKLNDNNHNKKFSVEKGVVKLDGNVFLKLDSLDDFQALAGALIDKRRHGFFDDTFKKNPITWKSNGKISFYGGEDYVLFKVENNQVDNLINLSRLLFDLDKMKKAGIKIDKTKIEQTNDNIKLGEYPLDENIWTNYHFWDTLELYKYTDLFDFGDGIIITEGKDGFFINKKPIKNVEPYKQEDLKSNPILKLERAN